jgi:hypothetical protein
MGRAKNDAGAAERRRIDAAKRQIAKIGLICAGTLHERTKSCGKAGCRCATDPNARHGPYYEWSWREDGRLIHRIVSAEQAAELERAISNYRSVQELLARWQGESATIILGGGKRKS